MIYFFKKNHPLLRNNVSYDTIFLKGVHNSNNNSIAVAFPQFRISQQKLPVISTQISVSLYNKKNLYFIQVNAKYSYFQRAESVAPPTYKNVYSLLTKLTETVSLLSRACLYSSHTMASAPRLTHTHTCSRSFNRDL